MPRDLCTAICNGDAALVDALIEEEGSKIVKQRGEDGDTPLMVAADLGRTEIGATLLSHGARVNSADWSKQTSLHLASSRGYLGFVEMLVDGHGAAVNCRNGWKRSPLMLAAFNDKLDVCLYLLARGADLRFVGEGDQTALDNYGQNRFPPLSPATLAERRTALEEAWRAGPHPSQVQRRKDEAWDRRKSLMQVSAENGYRPLLHRLLAEKAAVVDPTAPIPSIEIDTPAKRHAHLLGHVLSNEGIHRLIVSFL